jgi:two-component system, NtrC family, sensor kinase
MKLQAMNTKTVSFFAIVAFMLPLGLFAQIPTAEIFPKDVITLDSVREYEVMQQTSFFRDTNSTMTFENILQAAQKGAFTPVSQMNSILSPLRVKGTDALWLRLTVRNTKLTDWVLVVGNVRIDSATLYIPNTSSNLALTANDYFTSFSGEHTDLRTRAMQTKHVAFPLALTDDEPYTFFVRITAKYTPAVPMLRIMPAETFTEQARLTELVGAILLGMLLFAAVFNLVPLVVVRDNVYFWYIVHVMSLFAYTVFAATLLSERVIPLPMRPLANAMVQLGTYIIFTQFIRSFLDVKTRMPRIFDRLLLLGIALMFFAILFIPFGWERHYTSFRIPILLCNAVVVLVVLGREFWQSANAPTRIYALTMMSFVVIKFIMYFFGVQQESIITSSVGVSETMLFSFALASRVTAMREQVVQERKERELAQKLREQEQLRNTELASANQEISRQNNILAEQSREIELTNTHLNEVILELDTALTDLKETQTQLVASERLSAIGMLTAGVMHEINNPNAAVYAALEQMQLKEHDIRTFFLSLLDENDKNSPDALKFLRMTDEIKRMNALAMEGSSRVKQIVASLRTFTKHQEAGLKAAPLQEELASTLEMFRYQFKTVEVKQEYIGNTSIEANFGEINQVFLNLLVNAAQAGASVITITSEAKEHIVEVRVSDNAGGIPPHVVEHIYEPFYTTKGAGNSGLGLSISKKIMEKHKATMTVASSVGAGTTFTLMFSAEPATHHNTSKP